MPEHPLAKVGPAPPSSIGAMAGGASVGKQCAARFDRLEIADEFRLDLFLLMLGKKWQRGSQTNSRENSHTQAIMFQRRPRCTGCSLISAGSPSRRQFDRASPPLKG